MGGVPMLKQITETLRNKQPAYCRQAGKSSRLLFLNTRGVPRVCALSRGYSIPKFRDRTVD
jgi:hypothetical protein